MNEYFKAICKSDKEIVQIKYLTQEEFDSLNAGCEAAGSDYRWYKV